MSDRDAFVAAYRLEPHPEGGWFREFHRSARVVGPLPGYPGARAASTGIYFLLARGDFSAFHMLRSEETWVHLAGAPLELVLLDAGVRRLRLASAAEGGPPVAVVPPGGIQAARTTGDFTFVACLVAPGFEYEDFEILTRDALLRAHPEHADLVLELTR